MSEVVTAIRSRLGCQTPRDLAVRLGRPQYGEGVRSWETGKRFPGESYRNLLWGVIKENNWDDIGKMLQQAERANNAKRNGATLDAAVDARGKQHGREMTILEVCQLVEARVADMEKFPGHYARIYEGMIQAEWTTAQIVAYELKEMVARVRALPVTVGPRTREKAGLPRP